MSSSYVSGLAVELTAALLPSRPFAFGVACIVVAVVSFLFRKEWARRAVEIVRQLHWTIFRTWSARVFERVAIGVVVFQLLLGSTCILLSLGLPPLPLLTQLVDQLSEWSSLAAAAGVGDILLTILGLVILSLSVLGGVRLFTTYREFARAEAAATYERGRTARRTVANLSAMAAIGVFLGGAFVLSGISALCGG